MRNGRYGRKRDAPYPSGVDAKRSSQTAFVDKMLTWAVIAYRLRRTGKRGSARLKAGGMD